MQHAEAEISLPNKLVVLCCLMLTAAITQAQDSPIALRGTLTDNGKPIVQATVFLQSLADEACANLFTTGNQDRQSVQKLESCMRDLNSASPDAAGNFQFVNLRPGWYAVHFLWNITKKPDQSTFSQGRWKVIYAGHKDYSGRYDTMAQGAPFYFSGKEDVKRDFDLPPAQPPKPLRGRLSLDQKDWGVVLDLPGFEVKTVKTEPDGTRYMAAENENTNVTVSLTLRNSHSGGRASSCNESLKEKTKNTELKIRDIRYSHSGNLDLLHYTLPEFNGQPLNQESLFACQPYENALITLHISKPGYSATDEPLFTAVLESMHIDKAQRSSLELVEQGSRLYPLFYYNLACTYAEMGDATEAGNYLKKAFQYKANILPGETLPDPLIDDSFKKLMNNQEFRRLAETLSRSR